jgi:hypothetical protein
MNFFHPTITRNYNHRKNKNLVKKNTVSVGYSLSKKKLLEIEQKNIMTRKIQDNPNHPFPSKRGKAYIRRQIIRTIGFFSLVLGLIFFLIQFFILLNLLKTPVL